MTDLRQQLAALPEVVQDHVFDPDSADLTEKIVDLHGLSFEQERKLLSLEQRAYVKDLKIQDLAREIAKELQLDEERSKAVARDLAGYKLLPLDTFLGDVDGYIRSLGGDPAKYPPTRIRVEERTTEQAIEDVVGTSTQNVSHRLKGRLHDVVKSYLAGVRSESQLYEILTRAEKIGGVGLEADEARRIVEDVTEEKKTVSIKDEAKPKKEEAPAVEIEEDARGPEQKKPDSFATILPEDEEEIEQIKKKLPLETVAKAEGTDHKIRKSVDELFLATGIVLPNEGLQDRLKNIIENRLRDVRDQLETLEILAQPKELGGMSLSQDDARRVLSLIENKLKSVHSMHARAVTAEKRKWVEGEVVASIKRIEDEKDAEELKRDEAFRSVVARSKKAQKVIGGMPPKPTPKQAPLPGRPPTELPVIPAAKAPVPAPPKAPAPKPVPLPKPPVTIVRPSVKPLAVPGIGGSQAPGRPKMQDVKFAPKLIGPFEEIRKTSLEDFRRLSKDPKEAALKIKDKIDLQGEESFDNKMKAITAWNTSEVYKVYLEMMKEALEGKPMEQVITARSEAKKPALTQEEMGAIVQLGTQLRF